MNGPVDISPDHLKVVEEILHKNLPSGVAVWVFGSRASWATSDSSDLDLALEGDIDHDTILALEMAFEESSLPYMVDIIDLDQISDSFRRIVDAQKVIFPIIKDKSNTENNWHMVLLKDIVDLRISGVDKKTKNGEQLVRLCNYTDVYNNSFINADMDFMTATATEHEIFKCLLSDGDVIITKDSEKHDDIGVPALVHEDISNLVCGYHLAILRPTSKIDGAYLYYALNTDKARHQFQSYANGITRFGLRKADIGLVEIPLPSLNEQRNIAYILRTLDEKIDLNRRMNQTLEEMAQTLFKSWFVDFNPVRVKMDGRWRCGESLLGIPAEYYNIFPDRLVNSELGEMPEGWKVKALGELINVVGGSTPSTKKVEYWQEGIHCWATPKDLSILSVPVLLDTKRKITNAGLEKISSGLLPTGTLLLSARAPIGYLAISEEPTAINQGFIAIPPSKTVSNLFMLYWCNVFHDEIINYANGSTFLEISKKNFRLIKAIIPDQKVMTKFDNYIRPFYERMVSNERESRILTAQRNTLLPKLVSGEFHVEPKKRHGE